MSSTVRKSPEWRAFNWCLVTLITGGILVDAIAFVAVWSKADSSCMHYEILAPEVAGGYILCITGAAVSDLWFMEEKLSVRVVIVLAALFLISLVPVALCRAHAEFSQIKVLIMFVVTFLVALPASWYAKVLIYTVDETKAILTNS